MTTTSHSKIHIFSPEFADDVAVGVVDDDDDVVVV